jgi:hypothetical protein
MPRLDPGIHDEVLESQHAEVLCARNYLMDRRVKPGDDQELKRRTPGQACDHEEKGRFELNRIVLYWVQR